jgi:hypothetical protein
MEDDFTVDKFDLIPSPHFPAQLESTRHKTANEVMLTIFQVD